MMSPPATDTAAERARRVREFEDNLLEAAITPEGEYISRDYRRREYIDSRAAEDNLEPLLAADGTQVGWYDPVTDTEYPY